MFIPTGIFDQFSMHFYTNHQCKSTAAKIFFKANLCLFVFWYITTFIFQFQSCISICICMQSVLSNYQRRHSQESVVLLFSEYCYHHINICLYNSGLSWISDSFPSKRRTLLNPLNFIINFGVYYVIILLIFLWSLLVSETNGHDNHGSIQLAQIHIHSKQHLASRWNENF